MDKLDQLVIDTYGSQAVGTRLHACVKVKGGYCEHSLS